MVSVTQKSRNCLLLLLSLYQSMCPPFSSFFFTLLAVSLWPALALAALRTPKEIAPSMGHSNKSTSVPTHNVSTASPAIFNSPTATQSSYFYFPSTSPSSLSELRVTTPSNSVPSTSIMSVPLFDQTSPEDVLITSPTASTKVRHFGKKSSLSQDSSHCSVLQPFNQISRLLPHTCKHSTHKSRGSSLHKTLQSLLSEISLHPLQTAKPPSSPTSLFPLSDSTLPPASSQNASHKLPSPLSTSSSPTFITSPPPPPKPSPVPLPKRSPSPPEATPSHQPGPLLPPSLQHATDPLFEHQPFTVTWNIPDLVCNKYNISLDTSPFKGVATPAKVPGQFLSLFYTDRLGLYPHVDLTSRKKFHGGIPQRSNLRASMNKARADINYYIPSKTTRGLAVIDWEEWRPLWDRNWGTKRIYQSLSVAHVLQTNRSLTIQEATEKAKQQFQEAAKSFMSGMLAMGRAMRPNYLWGFYLFPNCYNYGWHEPDYTGQCSKEVRRQNDELLWLWESSTALYPSVYLQESLADDPKAALMVRNRVQEALRVSALPGRSATAPVFVYMRPVFVDQNRRFFSQVDLVSTIGEGAAVGASGAVLWGASADYDDQTSCKALSSYLTSTLNPYITNVTAAAQLCSNFLCRGNGRCVRKSYKSNHYLHLNAENFRVVRIQSRYLVVGRPTFANLKALSRRFTCRCYKGLSCSPRTHRELAKALMFSLKQGLYKKSRALIKTALDDTQQTSITKDNVKKNFNV